MTHPKNTGKTMDNEFVGLPEGEPQIPGEPEDIHSKPPISKQRMEEIIALSNAITDLEIKYPGTGINHAAEINFFMERGVCLENAIAIYQGVMFKKFGH